MRIWWACMLMLLVPPPATGAEEPAEPKPESVAAPLVTTKQGGTQFLSLSDWPVTRKRGVVTAAPLEEYLSLKFGQVSSRFEAVDRYLAIVEERLQALEAHQAALQEQLRLLEERGATPEGRHGDTSQKPQATEDQTAGGPQAADAAQRQ